MHTQTANEIWIFLGYLPKQGSLLRPGGFGQKKEPTPAIESKRPPVERLGLIRSQELSGAMSRIGSHSLAPSRSLELEPKT